MKTVRGCLTILTDNMVPGKSDAIGEHGFSVFLQTGRGSFLFDTGKGKTVVHNALVYKKDLSAINKILLSHGHGDHTGGLPEVLLSLASKPVDVFAHPDVLSDRYRILKNVKTYGGIPYTRGYLEKMGARFVLNKDYAEIEGGVFLTGEVPRKTPYEHADMDNRFLVRREDTVTDSIPDDQSLILHTEKGLLIILGCAHAGIINIINHTIHMTGIDTIYGIVGGTHIGFSGEEQLARTIEALRDYRIEHFVPSHCTGPEAIFRLRSEFKNVFSFSEVGFQMDF